MFEGLTLSKQDKSEIEEWLSKARKTELGQEVSKIEEIYGPYRSIMDISTEFLNNIKPKVTFSTTNTTSNP